MEPKNKTKNKPNQLEIELEKRLTSRGLILYAWDYFNSFESLHQQFPKVTDKFPVKYFLICHSIELAMKACLRERGYTRKQLSNIGHDLEKLIGLLYKQGVIMDVNSVKRTFILNDYYKTKQFEYPQTGSKSVPALEKMADITKLLLNKVSNDIYKKYP